MDNNATGKIQDTDILQPPPGPPYPMGNRIVDNRRPDNSKDQKGGEFHPLSNSTGDECRSNDSKHSLIYHKGHMRDRRSIICVRLQPEPTKPEPVKSSYNTVEIRTKGETVPAHNPLNSNNRNSNKTLHIGSQDIFPPDHSAIKHSESRCHEDRKSTRLNS